ncbi:Protein kinase domain-containing protein 9 [Elsinoe fawcettii]|nr:Protein kinase domain-containing protein 9 [Elsinoe fawcettii]
MEVSSRYQSHDRSRSLFGRGNHNQSEDSGTDAESRSRKKFQRTTNIKDDESTFRKPSLPASAMKQNGENKSNFLQRKRSVGREPPKSLHGPRPLENAGKRIFSEGNRLPPSDTRGPLLPSSSSMPVLDRKPVSKHRFSLGPSQITRKEVPPPQEIQSTQSFSFLPPVNFDDFQSSIASYEHGSDLNDNGEGQNGGFLMSNGNHDSNSSTKTDMPQTRSNNDMRIPSGQSGMSTGSDSQGPPRRNLSITKKELPSYSKDSNLAVRSRRQSALPTVGQPAMPSIANARSPRKSVGPGLLTNMLNNRGPQDEAPPLSAPVTQNETSRFSPVSRSRRRTLASQTNHPSSEQQQRAMAPTRSSKAKSMQPPARQQNSGQQDPMTPSDQQKRARSSSRPAANRNHLRATTPSSSGNKRQSGRASGLGARTISPTDARRLKRLSMMQGPMPPSKPSPTSSQLEPMPDLRSTDKSPSMIPRKMSLTPSSARETPDSNNLYMSATSLSRSSSYQSLRAVNNPGLPRMTQSPSLSRLPTPRTRNVYSSAEAPDEEFVPPVPAIPKAFESPKDQIDTPFFANAPKTLYNEPLSATSAHSYDQELGYGSTRNSGGGRKQSLSVPGPQQYASQSFSQQSMSARPSIDESRDIAPQTPAPKKKSLQPIRLPPLSLQPLSTPTAAKIAALPQPSQEVDRRDSTPPPKRGFAKTPSTPMTASKATFQRRYDEDTGKPSYNLRSSTSHHALRGVDHSAFDQFANAVPMPVPSNKRQITPFSSGSLPKTSAEYMPNLDKPLPDEYSLGHQEIRVQTSKPLGPRPRTASKSVPKDVASINTSSSNEDVETPPSSGSSLRRKFSLRFRSASKTANRHQADQPSSATSQDFPKMPPPKMPASAAWTEQMDSNGKTPSGSTRSSLETNRRRPSQVALSSTADSAQKPDPVTSAPRTAYRAMHSNPTPSQGLTPRSSSWSVAGQNRSAAPSAKPSQVDLKRRSPTSAPVMDKDDLAADDEMKRLALKRKDVESAARETDKLKELATPKQRMSPAQAIQSSSGLLNIYEKGEIIDYKEGVYFCGAKTAKKHVGDISAAGTTNFGYDDERGDYNICMGDHLAYRYEVIDVLGKGSFGQVVRCIDHKEGGLVAVKIIRNKKRFHQQALVEVNILNKLKEWDPDGSHATLTVTSSFYFRSHLCIVTPCLSINLYELIREHSFQGFSLTLIRRFARQILKCLQLLQGKRIIHCDLKPENILLCDPRRADVRVIDFGSSCKTDEKVYTYIQSRFYRSPEVILGSEYGLGIDMWSFGCILAELYTGYPIFPGENEQEQLACIMEIFGPPSRDIIEKCSRRKLFFDSSWKPRVTVSSKGRRRRPSSKSLNIALKCDDEAFLDFITQCLRWDPERRLRPEQAMNHPFIRNEPLRRIERPRPRTANQQPGKTTSTTTGGIPSPTKRAAPSATAAVSSTTTLAAQTPAKDSRARPLPQTPSTAIRGIGPTPSAAVNKGSPIKSSVPASRRQSSILPSAGGTEVPTLAGHKRLSSGITMGSSVSSNSGSGLPRMSSGRLANGIGGTTSGLNGANTGGVDLAGAAARESMGVANTRWR